MADIARIKRNIGKMIDMDAPEADIDAYIAEEGVTLDMLKGQAQPEERPLSMEYKPEEYTAPRRIGGEYIQQDRSWISPKTKQAISDIYTPVLQGTGMALGGVLGAPTATVSGFVGPATLAGVGGMAGTDIAHELDIKLGLKPRRNVTERVTQLGEDFTSAATMEAGGGTAGPLVARGVGKLISPLSRETADAVSQTKRAIPSEILDKARIAKEFGHDITPAELSGSKTLGIMEGVLNYRLLSGDVMAKQTAKRLDGLVAARNKLVAEKAPESAIATAGSKIRQEAKTILERYSGKKGAALDELVDEFMNKTAPMGQHQAGLKFGEIMAADKARRADEVRQLYTEVKNILPAKGQDLVPISGNTGMTAQRLLNEEMSKASSTQNKDLIKILEDFLPKDGGIPPELNRPEILARNPQLRRAIEEQNSMTWNGLDATRSELLERTRGILRETKGMPTKETRVYSAIAEAIDDDLAAFANAQGGQLSQTFNAARQSSRTLHELYDKDVLKIMDLPPEDIVRRVVNKGEVTLIDKIRKATGDEGLEPIRAGFFKQLLDSSTKGGVFNGALLKKNIAKLGDETLNALGTTEQIAAMRAIADKGIVINEKQAGMKTLEFLESIYGTSNHAVAKTIFRNPYNAKMAKRLLTPQRINEVVATALENDILKKSGAGLYLPISSAKEFAKNKATLQRLMKPGDFARLNDFIKLGQNAHRLESLANNPSQTGQIILGNEALGSIITAPLKAIKMMGLPWLIAKAYTNPLTMKYVMSAAKLPPNSPQATANFVKALEIIGRENMSND